MILIQVFDGPTARERKQFICFLGKLLDRIIPTFWNLKAVVWSVTITNMANPTNTTNVTER